MHRLKHFNWPRFPFQMTTLKAQSQKNFQAIKGSNISRSRPGNGTHRRELSCKYHTHWNVALVLQFREFSRQLYTNMLQLNIFLLIVLSILNVPPKLWAIVHSQKAILWYAMSDIHLHFGNSISAPQPERNDSFMTIDSCSEYRDAVTNESGAKILSSL